MRTERNKKELKVQYQLFVANLPLSITAPELRELLVGSGEIERLELLVDEETGQLTGRASLTWVTEEIPVVFLAWMNDLRYAEQRIAVSLAEPPSHRVKLSKSQRQLARQIADQLDEKERVAFHKIKHIVRFCGEIFARGLLEDTLAIEARGGLWLDHHQRRRTPGGVYLHLARQRLSPQMKRVIFVRRKKRKKSAAHPNNAARSEELAADPPVSPTESVSADDLSQPVGESALQDQASSLPLPSAALDEQTEMERQVGDRLAELQQAHQAAQDLLAAIKNGQAQGSAMAAMRQVLATQLALDQFRQQHPELS
jgi:RNA recognition motif-containing protein